MRDAMSSTDTIETLANREYKWGFVTEIEEDVAPRGLSEETMRGPASRT